MRLSTYSAVLAFVAAGAITGCSTSEPVTTPKSVSSDTELGGFTVALQGFRDAKGSDIEDPTGADPAYTNVVGQVYDGSYPELFVETELANPPDATEGCAVYAVVPPDCTSIGGCGAASRDKSCADAAANGTMTCVCVAEDLCEAYPVKKNLGKVTVRGIADTSGVTAFELKNLSNSYQIPPTTKLAYPGFAEGGEIEFAASGGDYEAFEVSAPGIAPLKLTNKPFNLAKDVSNPEPTAYQALTVTWTPPAPGSTSSILLEIDISRHTGTVGVLACDLDDDGEVTLSGSLISQLVGLGNVGGYPELTMSRWTTGATSIAEGVVRVQVESNVEPGLTMDGYTSCLSDADCPVIQVCNRDNKLCLAR